MWVILALLGVILAIAVVLVVIGIRNPYSENDMRLFERLGDFSKSGEQVDLEKLELSLPFTERVIYPLARKLGEITLRFTPQNWISRINRRLELAGRSSKVDATVFLTLQFIFGLLIGGFTFTLLKLLGNNIPAGRVFLFTLVMTLLGFYLPHFQLSSSITNRQKQVRKDMPDALDLLTICVEAGLGFDAAMARVAEKWNSPLSMAFARVIQEVQLGKLRREALHDMQDNIGISELTSFVAAIIQSEQLGVSMSKVLRVQADQMRVRRRQLAEEEAHKAPIKMLIPMAFLMFPSLLIILLAPAVLQIIKSGIFGG
ncbi:MAG TPA: type II secretion system F family protein [Anaerolineaceae bacterium]|jgi:tight adherence protein C|nr:type II secretion system F family protein [Anaerolineaceae bacterium]NMC18387.1 type II secretion system F family protein [Chloroflexota bacterium]HOM67834.1 type II secretion system F family protein [Brevefilum fermentans]HNR00991.1 type II secretion system F family protein [Anaerolineaceae bacterium]HNS06493.1 type II secretion system F family protein [Anaerolineaceae bacterium]